MQKTVFANMKIKETGFLWIAMKIMIVRVMCHQSCFTGEEIVKICSVQYLCITEIVAKVPFY